MSASKAYQKLLTSLVDRCLMFRAWMRLASRSAAFRKKRRLETLWRRNRPTICRIYTTRQSNWIWVLRCAGGFHNGILQDVRGNVISISLAHDLYLNLNQVLIDSSIHWNLANSAANDPNKARQSRPKVKVTAIWFIMSLFQRNKRSMRTFLCAYVK